MMSTAANESLPKMTDVGARLRPEAIKQPIGILETDTMSARSSISGYTKSTASISGAGFNIDIHSTRLIGREKETQILLERFEEADGSRQLVLVGGAAGSGKSAVTKWLQKYVNDANRATFVSGKYTLTKEAEPYAAFVEVCREICFDLTSYAGNDAATMGSDLSQSSVLFGDQAGCIVSTLKSRLGSQVRVLSRVIPSLRYLLSDSEHAIGDEDTQPALRLDERHQLHIAFRTFFRALCEVKRQVIVLDDLQWADQASVDLLRYLISDRDNSGLLIVGCFRDDEIEGTPFSAALETMKQEVKDSGCTATEITIKDLDVESVSKVVESVLPGNTSLDVLSLAKVIHTRTLGNAFFSVQFLKSLVEDDLIIYDVNMNECSWDLDQIRLSTTATTNAVELMVSKLEKLPSDLMHLAQLASCLGTVVHTRLFKLIVTDFRENKSAYVKKRTKTKASDRPKKSLNADEAISRFVGEGLFYKASEDSFRWEHDKILEAAMISQKKNRAKVHNCIGQLLLSKLDEDELDRHLLVVVRLLNDGASRIASTDIDMRIRLAELNLLAGKKSLNNSGFESSTGYFKKGIELLPSNHTRVHKSLSVDLYSSAAEAEYCVGDLASMESHCRDVISRPNIALSEKRRAYSSLMNGLSAQGKGREAFAIGSDLLDQLGCALPKMFRTPRILAGVQRMKVVGKRGIATELEKLPLVSDPEKLWALDVLADLFLIAYISDLSKLLAIVAFKGLDCLMDYGRSPKTALFLTQLSIVAMVMGEYNTGSMYADQAIIEIKKSQDERLICDVSILAYTFAWHWSHDIDTDALRVGYLAGIAVGAVENASWCINNYLEQKFFIGAPLGPIHEESIKYAHQMKEFNVDLPYDCTIFIWQATENMMGLSDETSKLRGSHMVDDKYVEGYLESGNFLCLSVMRYFQFFLAFYFDDFDRIFEVRKVHSEAHLEKAIPALFSLCLINYTNAIAAISLYRKHGKRQYLRIFKKLSNKLKGWTDAGNPNTIHYVALLDAELAALNGKEVEARKQFNVAIGIAEKRKQTNDAAKVEQRFAEFEMRQGRMKEAEKHMVRAVELYDEWGAVAVSASLRQRYPQLLCPFEGLELDL